jgi:non-canonical poly(A) RNA polymerase PAPD5/7
VIKLVFETSELEVDITLSDFDIDPHFQSGYQTITFVHGALTTSPVLKQVCLMLKTLLANKDMNQTYSGGLGSFGLFVMLMSVYSTMGYPEMSSAHLLSTFLMYYGSCFSPYENIITYYGTKTRLTQDGSVYHIEHPVNEEINVSKGGFRMLEIQELF